MNRSNHAQIEPLDGRQPLGPVSVALTMLTVMLWGGTPVSIKYSVDLLPPFAVSGVRFVMAAIFMLFWCRWEGSQIRLRPGQYSPTFITGLLLFLQIGCFTLGVHLSNASHGTLFINTFIFWVAAIDHFIMRTDRLSSRKLLGLIVAAAGVVVIVMTTSKSGSGSIATRTDADTATLWGDLILLTSGCLLGIKIVYTKHALKKVEPGKLIFWHDVIGVLMFAAYSAVFETIDFSKFDNPTDPKFINAILGLLYQGLVVAGFCFAVQTMLLRKHAASKIAVFSFATPLFGVALAVLFRGEQLSPWLLVAGACITTGIFLVNFSLPNKPASASTVSETE